MQIKPQEICYLKVSFLDLCRLSYFKRIQCFDYSYLNSKYYELLTPPFGCLIKIRRGVCKPPIMHYISGW